MHGVRWSNDFSLVKAALLSCSALLPVSWRGGRAKRVDKVTFIDQ